MPIGVDRQVCFGNGSRVVRRQMAVVIQPIGPDFAFEMAVGARWIRPERGNGGVEIGTADPAKLSQCGRHPIGREVFEDLECGDKLEGPVLPGKTGKEIANPNMALSPRGRVGNGKGTETVSYTHLTLP